MAGRLRRRPAAAAVILGILVLGASPDIARAAEPAANRPNGIESALVTRIAYVITGDATVDETSRAGLTGLTQMLASRTALEPGEPAGIDPAKDELAFYPLIYWPIVPNRPLPGEAAIRRIDAFMKNGGTVIFDTRDAMTARPGGPPTPEALTLQRMLATLEVPELEPVPRDHVLTKAFYLVDSFPGRYATGQTWVEALPPAGDGAERRPARAGDGVSPIVITGNDLASAWAVGRRGEALYPLVGGDPRQREMSYRGGVNLVMYALTGNYKADQVHVPALLERLGSEASHRTTGPFMLSLSLAPLVPVPVLWAWPARRAPRRGRLPRPRAGGAVARPRPRPGAAGARQPSLVQEEREPVKDVVAVVVDRSGSQGLGDRPAMTDTVRAELQRRLGTLNQIEPRFVDVPEAGGDEGTRLFTALSSALADVPPDRLAGVVMLTDGVVHDIPANLAASSFKAPLHVLVTGRPDERDRQIRLIEAPRFGIVGRDQTIRAEVMERGGTGSAVVTVRRDGEQVVRQTVRTGQPFGLTLRVEHGGPNVVEIEAEALPGE